jgi:hypothetical protein
MHDADRLVPARHVLQRARHADRRPHVHAMCAGLVLAQLNAIDDHDDRVCVLPGAVVVVRQRLLLLRPRNRHDRPHLLRVRPGDLLSGADILDDSSGCAHCLPLADGDVRARHILL